MTALDVSTIEEAKARYDAQARRVLAQRPILSRILLGTMGELSGMTPEEVEACIEGDPDVAETPVGPGSAIRGGAREDSVPDEGVVRYDILTHVNVPGERGPVRVIVNVEAQRDCSPGYEIVTRGVFYASRLISSQLGVEFGHSDYDSIKKVYSIWICMDAPRGVGNAITSWSFAQTNHLGALPDRPAAYDKAQVVVVALDEGERSDNELVGMLGLLFSPNVPKKEKIEGLRRRYDVPVRGDVEKGVNVMCNLSDYVEKYATERGMARGMEQGMARGMARGMEQGMARGMARGMEQGMEQGMARGMEQGMARGMERKLTELVVGNLGRGRSYEQVADSLMISVDEVRRLEQKALAPA